MNDKTLYEKILGLDSPWHVADVVMDLSAGSVTIRVEHEQGTPFCCPECGKTGSVHDHRLKRWRHLPTCQLRTIIEAPTPRVNCPTHGVRLSRVPWADGNSKFTTLFEALVIGWLQETSISAVTRMMDLSWFQVDAIRSRAVKRGLSRRRKKPSKALGIDETSFQKRHEYVTVVVDQHSKTVIDVLDDRKMKTLQEWFELMEPEVKARIETIAMDMWDPFIGAVRNTVPGWENIVCFDRFHVSSHYGKALDKVRSNEHRSFLKRNGQSPLARTKHQWLRNSSRTDNRTRRWFMELTRKNLKTGRAWAMKETAANLWEYVTRNRARGAWERLIGWMRRSRLDPMKRLAHTLKRYLWGILNAIVHSVTNATSEAINGRIQWIKKTACGFRNRNRFREAILFHLGGLELMPECQISAT